MNRDQLLDLIPAYALDALDEDEKKLVGDFLKDDAEAQSLLAEYDAVTSILTLHVAERPAPSHLRTGLQAKLAERRADNQSEASSTDTPSTIATHITPFPTTILLTTAAALFIVLVGFIAFISSDSPLSINEALYNQLIDADNARQFSVIPNVATDVNGELVVASGYDEAILRIASLPDKSTEESYQLWLITEEEIHSGGLFFWETGHGPYFVEINPDLVDDVITVAMTIEPIDGSPLGNAPSSTPLFSVDVPTGN